MDKLAIKTIRIYQKIFSLDSGFLSNLTNKNVCVFYPNCSEYTIQSLEKYGFIKGSFLGIRRILRCHPWQKNHIDLVK